MLSRNLKLLRSSLGMTQDKLASFLGISRSTYSSYENGRREPSMNVLGKIADLAGCDLATLYEKDEKVVKSQLVYLFRTDGLTNNDLDEIASFKKFVLSYQKMDRLLNEQLRFSLALLGAREKQSEKYICFQRSLYLQSFRNRIGRWII